MRRTDDWKGIFCLEGLWDSNLKTNSSVEPILHLLHREYPKLNYIHKDCATKAEFEFYIKKWAQKRYDDHPVLYLAFHGEENYVKLADGTVSIKELGEYLEGQCKNRIIVLASCSTLNMDKRIIKSFITKTGCLAVCGYRSDVDWIQSAAFELLLLEGIQDNEFSGRGIGAISDYLKELAKKFPDLGFRIVSNRD